MRSRLLLAIALAVTGCGGPTRQAASPTPTPDFQGDPNGRAGPGLQLAQPGVTYGGIPMAPRPTPVPPTPTVSADEAAMALAWNACVAGDGAQCVHAAELADRRVRALEAAPSTVVNAYARGCQARNAAACTRVGTIYSSADYLLWLPDQAARYFGLGCGLGDPQACVGLARLHEDGEVAAGSYATAVELYDQACRAGLPSGCDGASRLRGRPEPAPGDRPVRSPAEQLERTCGSGSFDACVSMGDAYEHGTPPAPRRALALYGKLCAYLDADPRGCNKAAVLYRDASSPLHDARAAAQYAQRACGRLDHAGRIGDARELQGGAALAGCHDLATQYLQGDGVPKDASRAAEVFNQACARLHGPSCTSYGLLLRRGDEGFPKDEATGVKVLAYACTLGEAAACQAGGSR